MSPNPPHLRVIGECTFPTSGYRIYLTRRPFEAGTLVLQRVFEPPPALPVPQVITTVMVEYAEPTSKEIKIFEIQPDDVKIKPEKVH